MGGYGERRSLRTVVDPGVLADASERLVAAVEDVFAGWVRDRMLAVAPAFGAVADEVADRCAAVLLPRLRSLVAEDVDRQRTTPLQLVRDVMAAPTAALSAAGVAPPRRDPVQVGIDPGDVYDLGPVRWSDLGEAVGDAALVWGGAMALVHLVRHRNELGP
jgi:hypothetical protein